MLDWKQFITQKDENCDSCGCELPKGSHCFMSEDELICEDCSLEREANSLIN